MSLIVQVNNAGGGTKAKKPAASTQQQPSSAPPGTLLIPPSTMVEKHIVQHHPPPISAAAADPRLRMISLPQSPVRQASLAGVVPQHVRLPQSPVRQHHLRQPIAPPHHRLLHHAAQHRQPVIVSPSSSSTSVRASYSLLPQNTLLPSSPLPFPPSNLVPQPPNSSPSLNRNRLPPLGILSTSSRPLMVTNAQVVRSTGQPGRRKKMDVMHEDFEAPSRFRCRNDIYTNLDRTSYPLLSPLSSASSTSSASPLTGLGRHNQVRHHVGSPRVHARATTGGAGVTGNAGSGGRGHNWQCSALQDHNYSSRPPPTPPPSPPLVSATEAVSQAHFASGQQHVLQSSFTSVPSSNPSDLLGRSGSLQHPFSSSSSSSLPPPPPTHLLVPAAAVVQQANEAPAPVPQTREEKNNQSIEDAGVGPMAPLGEDSARESEDENDENASVRKRRKKKKTKTMMRKRRKSRTSSQGEDTETAPEEDDDEKHQEGIIMDQDDSITRCICDFLHDDGYMICCDKCSVWQHVVCMGLDRNNIPDVYLCEVCLPRQIDRKKAKSLQARRRTEIFPRSSSSDNDNAHKAMNRRKPGSVKKPGKKSLNAKPLVESHKVNSGAIAKKREDAKKKAAIRNKRKSSEGKVKRTTRRKSLAEDDFDLDDEDDSENSDLEPRMDDSQQLRAWIDKYEEAVTNHYSPELRARLGVKGNIPSDLRPSVIGGPVKCNVSLKGNGVKILTASTNVMPNTPIIECKGRVMLSSQYRRSPSKHGLDNPHVFYYNLGDSLDICLDGKTYGNDARFCRRSTSGEYNAELRHVVDKGSLHLFIVAIKSIDKNQEIVLAGEARTDSVSPVQEDLKEIGKKANGVGNSSSADEMPLNKAKERKKKEKKKNNTKLHKERKPIKKPKVEEEDEEEEKINSEEEMNGEQSNQASKGKPSPGKLGLPDDSGLIVGVNTINYDASSSLKNKAKSREERKMEMIMRAIEAMERAEQRKKDHTEHSPGQDRAGRRKSTSGGKTQNHDSNVEASSADEGGGKSSTTRKRTTRKGSTGGGPKRRRSRALSGGSASAISESENVSFGGETSSATPNTASSNGPFRFPKTKKSMMSDWLHESIEDDDDVSGNYLRGSRSPVGIATHLLRGAVPSQSSPQKSVCSAKKRWLRQAISEDHTEEVAISPPITHNNTVLVNGETHSAVAGGAIVDYVTPLKKRRLASYQDEQDAIIEDEAEARAIEEQENKVATLAPNSLKKKLLHNLVLEAVLDKAMEDMLGNDAKKQEEEVQEGIKVEEKQLEKLPESVMKEEGEEEVPLKVAEKKNPCDSVLVEDQAATSISATTSTIKTPEPSSVFKSFFKSNVSIEDLEAEIEATKRQRLEGEDNCSKVDHIEEQVKKEELEEVKPDSKEEIVKVEERKTPEEDKKRVNEKPKEKRRVSLADYKKRRKQESISSTPSTVATNSAAAPLPNLSSILSAEDGTSTPTLDEAPSKDLSDAPTTLNPLPLFAKLEKLEQAQKENKKKAQSTLNVDYSAPMEPKREDLTERLKKEFGLTVEEEEKSKPSVVEGDATPEQDSGNSAPVPSATSSTSGQQQRLTQYPSYPSNFPLPPYPKSGSYSVNQSSSSSSSSTKPPQRSHSKEEKSSRRDNYYASSPRGYYGDGGSRKSGERHHRDYYQRDRDYNNHHYRSSSSSGSSSRPRHSGDRSGGGSSYKRGYSYGGGGGN